MCVKNKTSFGEGERKMSLPFQHNILLSVCVPGFTAVASATHICSFILFTVFCFNIPSEVKVMLTPEEKKELKIRLGRACLLYTSCPFSDCSTLASNISILVLVSLSFVVSCSLNSLN